MTITDTNRPGARHAPGEEPRQAPKPQGRKPQDSASAMPRPVKTDTPVSLDKQMQAAKGSFPLDAVVEINVAALVGSAVAAAALPPVLTGIGVPPIERIVTSTDPSGKKKLTSLLEEDFGSLGILHKGWRRKVQAACKDATKKSVKTDE